MDYNEKEKEVLTLIKKGYRTREALLEKTKLSKGELELVLTRLILKNKLREAFTSGKCDCSKCPLRSFCPLAKKS